MLEETLGLILGLVGLYCIGCVVAIPVSLERGLDNDEMTTAIFLWPIAVPWVVFCFVRALARGIPKMIQRVTRS